MLSEINDPIPAKRRKLRRLGPEWGGLPQRESFSRFIVSEQWVELQSQSRDHNIVTAMRQTGYFNGPAALLTPATGAGVVSSVSSTTRVFTPGFRHEEGQ